MSKIPHIVYETEDFFIVNKPSHYYSHPNHPKHNVISLVSCYADKMHFPPTNPDVVNMDNSELNNTENEDEFVNDQAVDIRKGLVHRLDRETFGLVILAKHQDALQKLQLLFKNREIVKKYQAIVKGNFFEYNKYLKHRLARDPRCRTRRIVLDSKQNTSYNPYRGRVNVNTTKTVYGETAILEEQLEQLDQPLDIEKLKQSKPYKIAESKVSPLQFFTNNTLVEVEIFTGRTHQIRVQLAHLGYPIVGDTMYDLRSTHKKKTSRQTHNNSSEKEQELLLCAYYLKFVSPFTKEDIEIKIDLPDYFNHFITTCDGYRLHKYNLKKRK